MRGKLFVAAIAFALAALVASPVGAITYGEPDNGAHPYVGLVVFYDEAGEPTHRCSGTLLSATVFLTAGHCTSGAASAAVWFDDEVTLESGYPFTGGIPATPYTHPGYDDFSTFPNTSDLGVVVLDEGQPGPYGVLPKLGRLDRLATKRGTQDVTFTVVGYGLQEIKPDFQADRVRYRATSQLTNLRSALTDGFNIHTSNAPGIGGGTCFGDSGGPVFIGNTATLAAVTSFGLNQNCKGADFAYRVDIENARTFLSQFVALP